MFNKMITKGIRCWVFVAITFTMFTTHTSQVLAYGSPLENEYLIKIGSEELRSFEGILVDEKVVLNWKTLKESNNDFFEVERSNESTGNEVIAKVKSASLTLDEKTYKCIDDRPIEGKSLYRLIFVHTEGIERKTEWISVDYTLDLHVSIYPNSDIDDLVINVSGIKTETKVVVSDLGGNVVLQKTIRDKNDNNEIMVGKKKLQNGTYILGVVSGDKKIVKRIYINN